MEMEIRIENGKAKVFTPYNPDFVKGIKKLGKARWDGDEKCWVVPEQMIEDVRAVMKDVYGYDDITPNETVTLQVVFTEKFSEWHGSICLFGKVIATAFGRDSGAKVGEDVVFLSDEPYSSGSVKNWYTSIDAGAVAKIYNVNKRLYEENSYDGIEVTVEETVGNKKVLQEEKQRLLDRIAEIDKLLMEE